VSVDTVSLFLALLAVVAQVTVLVALVLSIGGRLSPTIDARRAAAADAIGPPALAVAFAVAAVATAGSLYFSEVANFTPCRLCWYQRICMYPLVPLLGLAAWKHDRGIRPYAAVLAGTGALIAAYHVLVERFPSLESDVCEPTNPCTVVWVERIGYITIPTMALSGFALVLTLLAVADPVLREPASPVPAHDLSSRS
jgi:disulfide bond formation protein DsbB